METDSSRGHAGRASNVSLKCRVRINHAAQYFANLRRIAMNLLRRRTQEIIGLKNRRAKACINDSYRAQHLAWAHTPDPRSRLQ